MVYTLHFSSSKSSLFHNSNVFVSCIIHILYIGCAKIKKVIPAPNVQIWYILSVFSSSKCILFHNSNIFGFYIIHFLYTECAKIKKIIPAPKLRHGIYSPFFSFSKCIGISFSKCILFHNSNVFGSFIIHIFYTGCAKIKKIIPSPKVRHVIYSPFFPS